MSAPRLTVASLEDALALLGAVRQDLSDTSERIGEMEQNDPGGDHSYWSDKADRLERWERRIVAAARKLGG